MPKTLPAHYFQLSWQPTSLPGLVYWSVVEILRVLLVADVLRHRLGVVINTCKPFVCQQIWHALAKYLDIHDRHHGMEFFQLGFSNSSSIQVPSCTLVSRWQPLIIISSWDHLFLSNMVDCVCTVPPWRVHGCRLLLSEEQWTLPYVLEREWSRHEKESHLVIFLVTSQTRHILSRGNSFFRAVLWTMKIWRWEGCCQRWYWWCCWWDIENADDDATCIIAVRNDCGLKNPGSQTEIGRLKSPVQPFWWWLTKILTTITILTILVLPCNSLILKSRSAYLLSFRFYI